MKHSSVLENKSKGLTMVYYIRIPVITFYGFIAFFSFK